jgi:predicted DNA-binding transcriptional regulator AlpA
MQTLSHELLTEAELSKFLGLSRPTLVRHRRCGTGPTFVRLSARRVAYRRSAVEAWLGQQERCGSGRSEQRDRRDGLTPNTL